MARSPIFWQRSGGSSASGQRLPWRELADGRDWRLCEALLTLHAIADEACAGLGVALDRSDGKGCLYRRGAANCWQEPNRWPESRHTFCAGCPRSARTPTEPRGARSRATPVYSVQGWTFVGTGRRLAGLARNLGSSIRTCCCRPGRCGCENPISTVWRARRRGWPRIDPFGLFEFAPLEGLDLDLL